MFSNFLINSQTRIVQIKLEARDGRLAGTRGGEQRVKRVVDEGDSWEREMNYSVLGSINR